MLIGDSKVRHDLQEVLSVMFINLLLYLGIGKLWIIVTYAVPDHVIWSFRCERGQDLQFALNICDRPRSTLNAADQKEYCEA